MSKNPLGHLGAKSRAFYQVAGSPPSGTHFLYLIATLVDGRFFAPVKIGISNDPEARLRNIQTSCPNRIGIVHRFALPTREIARVLEAAFHAVKREHRTSGEWFSMSPTEAMGSLLVNFLAAMEVQGVDPCLMSQIKEKSGFGAVFSEILDGLCNDGGKDL